MTTTAFPGPLEHFDWQHIYLLGWEDHAGQSYLSTWSGDLPWVEVVVHNTQLVPLWNAPVPPSARLESIPEGEDGREYAQRVGGFFAFGWYVKEGVSRRCSNPPFPKKDPRFWPLLRG